MSHLPKDLENIKRWGEGDPILGQSHALPQLASTSTNTEVIAHPFYSNVTPKSNSGIERWTNPEMHADAVAAVMLYAAKRFNYQPSTGIDGLVEAFENYLKAVVNFPGFTLMLNDSIVIPSTMPNVDEMIGDVVDAYKGLGIPIGINGIIDSIEKMANTVLNMSSTDSNQAIFSQDVITKDENAYYIAMLYTNLTMEVNQSGKRTYADQRYTIQRYLIKVNSPYLVTYAEKLEQLIGSGGLEEWYRTMQSSTGHRRSCLADKKESIIKALEAAAKEV